MAFPKYPRSGTIPLPIGAVAQLGERLVRNEEVRGSIPLGSTSYADTQTLPQASVFIHDLRPDRRVFDLVVFDQQECLRQYQGERRVALERQADIGTLVLAILHDAQILAVRLHLDVSGTEMDAIRP